MNAPTSMLEIMPAVALPIQPRYTPEPKRGARREAHRRAGTAFGQLQGSRSPFKRALRYIELIQAIVLKGLKPLERQAELDALPPYQSRGHGGKHRARHRLTFVDRSKYNPRECFSEGRR